MAQEVCSIAELETVVKNAGSKLVLVNYSSPKCGLCKKTNAFCENLREEHPEILFIKVDTEAAKEFIDAFGIKGLPAFQFYRYNKKCYEFAGANTQHLYEKMCEFN